MSFSSEEGQHGGCKLTETSWIYFAVKRVVVSRELLNSVGPFRWLNCHQAVSSAQ